MNGNFMLISVTNSCVDSINSLYTSKTEKAMHGYGMNNIKKAVNKMGGISSFSVENNEFCFVAKLPVN